MTGDFRGHCRRAIQAGVHPAEIVVRHVDRSRRGQILQFLREAEQQARKPFRQGSRRQIDALDVALANRPRVYRAKCLTPIRANEFRGGRSVRAGPRSCNPLLTGRIDNRNRRSGQPFPGIAASFKQSGWNDGNTGKQHFELLCTRRRNLRSINRKTLEFCQRGQMSNSVIGNILTS